MKNHTAKQLFKPVGSLKLFSHYAMGELSTKDGTNIPFLMWPNGLPCVLGNLYMLSLRDRAGRGGRQGLSRRGSKGGSLGDYASKISQLLRYCFRQGIELIELSDQSFTDFIAELRNEVSPNNPESDKKSETTITSVGRICLDFLNFTGRFYGDNDFVSTDGTIRTTNKVVTIKTRSGQTIKRTYIHHHSLSDGNRLHTRNPITTENIECLRTAINQIPSSRFIQFRRHALISLLEHTGARRGEISQLKISDVINAASMKDPMLRLETWKQGDNKERLIPVTKMLLNDLNKFIIIYRKKVARKFLPGKDHGYFFISETTGKQMAADSITNEISTLRRQAHIETQACAHMFRHAFITNLFVLLIQRHNFENPDSFRNALLDSHMFIAEVMQWTGHRDPTSLVRYIHLAFAKLASYANTISSIHLIRALEIFDQKQAELVRNLENGMPVSRFKEELKTLIKLRDEDLKTANRRETEK